jgi:formate-dependent nitrite reductase membrane component NrfD
VTVIATLPFVLIGGGTSYWLIGAAMVFRGFGIGMSMMPSMTAAFAVLRPDQVSHATPQLNVLQRVGGSMGTAILSVVLGNHLDSAARAAGGRPSADALAGGFGATYWWVLGVTAFALIPTALLAVVERRAKQAGHEPAVVGAVAETALEAAA